MTTVAVLIQLYMVFLYAPTEKFMGDVQRLMYFHIPSAFSAFAAFALVFVMGIVYLVTKKRTWDLIAVSSAEIGVLFTTLTLITGSIWARPVWNAWWVWDDPRLVTTLILWFMYIAYLLIRSSIAEDTRRRKFASVFGIIAFIDVPIVYFSVLWWRTIHPKVIDETGIHMPPEMTQTLFVGIIAFLLLYAMLLLYRTTFEYQREAFISIKQEKLREGR
ncbi:cytochrome c biogenesis protein [Novibacillus thermophilus]|uniref:cytochrome c biogenesis protein n=1 Tax=Novibacillus thermophilus TaxID=1471761 RepID=UPI001E5DF188|nr:cytochrome c biogenesis protein CcsA [Novibacillus thermophilus]